MIIFDVICLWYLIINIININRLYVWFHNNTLNPFVIENMQVALTTIILGLYIFKHIYDIAYSANHLNCFAHQNLLRTHSRHIPYVTLSVRLPTRQHITTHFHALANTPIAYRTTSSACKHSSIAYIVYAI